MKDVYVTEFIRYYHGMRVLKTRTCKIAAKILKRQWETTRKSGRPALEVVRGATSLLPYE
jgi:hypothetical protein